MTVADAIRRMTDEELAEYMKGMVVYILEQMLKGFQENDIAGILDALRSEVEL